MRTAMRAERLARVRSEERYEREQRQRVEAEERLRLEVDKRVEAESEVARLRTIEEAQKIWTDAAAEAFALSLVSAVNTVPPSGVEPSRHSSSPRAAADIPMPRPEEVADLEADDRGGTSLRAKSKGKGRMVESDDDRDRLGTRQPTPLTPDRTDGVLERAAGM